MDAKEYIYGVENEKPLDRMVSNGGFCSIFRSITVIGDSLANGTFESYKEDGSRRFHEFPEYSWPAHIARSTGSMVQNFSRGGMSAKEYIESYADKMCYWDKCKLTQAYIIALGANDIASDVPLGSTKDVCMEDCTKNAPTIAGFYAQIIQRIKALQPRAKIFLVSMPQGDEPKDEERKAFRDILECYTKMFNRTYLIDLFTYAPINDAKYKDLFRLGHLTPAGYVFTARMIESYIDYIIRHNQKDFNQIAFIGTDLQYAPEEEY